MGTEVGDCATCDHPASHHYGPLGADGCERAVCRCDGFVRPERRGREGKPGPKPGQPQPRKRRGPFDASA